MLKLSDFDYNLPKELIAQYPLKTRDAARLLVLRRNDAGIGHAVFKDLSDYLSAGDLLVLNDTKVLPSRLIGRRKSGGKAEVLLLAQKQGLTFEALIKPARLKQGERIIFDSGKISGELSAKKEITFLAKDIDEIYAHGLMPLPPYIKRQPQDQDKFDYQTVYAINDGSVASPTAGLHFTQGLLKKIKSCGINIAYITLHIGYSTFKPVKAEDITQHKMQPEPFSIPQETIEAIKKTHKNGRKIIAVGTTSLRALEAYASGAGLQSATDLFIYPGYEFKLADCLVTNFHLPRTTLFMLACAFAGEGLLKKSYLEAIDKKYRFYSYGDAMLIL